MSLLHSRHRLGHEPVAVVSDSEAEQIAVEIAVDPDLRGVAVADGVGGELARNLQDGVGEVL